MSATKNAFDRFRSSYGPARLPPPGSIANGDETVQIDATHGLSAWADGDCRPRQCGSGYEAPALLEEHRKKAHLWVVRTDDVVHAFEHCAYGKTLQTGVIKHTNLTGGAAAFCGGELLFINENTICINGRSRRYGPRSAAEMAAVANSFKISGYNVWSMGYDEETGEAFPFIGTKPKWV